MKEGPRSGADIPATALRRRRPLERDDDFLVVDANRVTTDAQPLVDEATPRRDVELPLVPGAPQDARVGSDGDLAVVVTDRRGHPSGAEPRAAMGAAVGEGVEAVGDAEEADAKTADLEHADTPFRGRLGD